MDWSVGCVMPDGALVDLTRLQIRGLGKRLDGDWVGPCRVDIILDVDGGSLFLLVRSSITLLPEY